MSAIEVGVYEMTDHHGNVSRDACTEYCDAIQLYGTTKDGEKLIYDDDACHSFHWAEAHGFKMTFHKIVLDIEKQRIASWKTTP